MGQKTTGNKPFQEIVAELLSLGRSRKTGTLSIELCDGRASALLLRNGLIGDVDPKRENSVLVDAILRTGKLGEKDLKRCKKAQAKSGGSVGALLLLEGKLPEDQLVASVQAAFVDAVCSILTAEASSTSFVEHGTEERLESFCCELSDALDVSAEADEMVISAARRVNRWDVLESELPLLADVLYATPAAARYFGDDSSDVELVQLLSRFDGRATVAEAIKHPPAANEEPRDPFDALAAVRGLVARRELDRLNPVQLFQLGVEEEKAGHSSKALRLFQRASELGLDDFDLGHRIATGLEAQGRTQAAAERYQAHAEKCLAQYRADDAIKSYERACALAPSTLPWQRRYMDLLLQENRTDALAEQAVRVAECVRKESGDRAALNFLLDIRRRGAKGQVFGRRVLDLATACGDEATAKAERQRLAGELCDRKDLEKALAMYQQLFCEGNRSNEVRLKLVELHRQKGNVAEALDHVAALLTAEQERIRDAETLLKLHEIVAQHNPGEHRSSRWLVEHHLKSGNTTAAVVQLKAFLSHHEREKSLFECQRALSQLVALEPKVPEHRVRLARIHAQQGRGDEQVRCLKEAARLFSEAGNPAEAEKILDELLRARPFEAAARSLFGELLVSRGDAQRGATLLRESAMLSTLCGEAAQALGALESLLRVTPDDVEVLVLAADSAKAKGDETAARERLVQAARAALDADDRGRARSLIERAAAAQASAAALTELRAQLEAKISQSGQAKEPVAAAVVVPVAVPATASAVPKTEAAGAPSAETALASHAPFEAAVPVVQRSVSGIMAKLRNLKSGPPPAERTISVETTETPETAAPTASGVDPAASTKPRAGGLGGAASKLKALASGGAAQPATPPPVPRNEPAQAPPKSTDHQELERLQASLQNEAAPAAPPKGAPTKSLGKSAALLSRLRKPELQSGG